MFPGFWYWPFGWAPNLDPKTYQTDTIYHIGPIEQTRPESNGPITSIMGWNLGPCTKLPVRDPPLRSLGALVYGPNLNMTHVTLRHG